MSFKEFLKENEDTLQFIHDILDDLSEEEINEFGWFLTIEFMDDFEFEEEDDEFFELQDVKDMIDELGIGMYDFILDALQEEELDDEGSEYEEEEFDHIGEGVSRRMDPSQRNKKKRKFFGLSQASLRKTKAERKRELRKSRPERRRYYRANKKKIQAYQKSRAENIKKGKHIVKLRRKSG